MINAIIDSLPQQVDHTAVVRARELTDKGDQTHFDTPSTRELGLRYAAAVKILQGMDDRNSIADIIIRSVIRGSGHL